MCELFGITSLEKIQVNSLLKEFFSHSQRHPHGWGMAVFYGNYVSLEKEPVEASYSNYLNERLQTSLRVCDMIAHIRQATRGSLKYNNCHPFIKRDNYGRCWTLAHNGTVFDAEKLEPYVDLQEGNTDSERILYYLLDSIDQKQEENGSALEAAERFEILEKKICELTPGNKLNLLFYDGEYLYAHTNYANSLYYKQYDGRTILATVPLDQEDWYPVPFAKLVVYKGAQLVYQGTLTGMEYKEASSLQNHEFLNYSSL